MSRLHRNVLGLLIAIVVVEATLWWGQLPMAEPAPPQQPVPSVITTLYPQNVIPEHPKSTAPVYTDPPHRDLMLSAMGLLAIVAAILPWLIALDQARRRLQYWHWAKLLIVWSVGLLGAWLAARALVGLFDAAGDDAVLVVGTGLVLGTFLVIVAGPLVLTWNWLTLRERPRRDS